MQTLLQAKFPLLSKVMALEPVIWLNPIKNTPLHPLPLTIKNMNDAECLWHRFAPYLENVFPELKASKGIIESPLKKISHFKLELEKVFSSSIEGDLYLKCDNALPIAGSIKARGGFYEVLHYAETLAIEAGFIRKEDDYQIFSSDKFKHLFSQYTIGVGSTGNLGLSIGLIGVKLGFNVVAYMSADAKRWKKDLLREKGAKVYESAGDFSKAIHKGREDTIANPKGYFVDDEDSELLFLGYSTAAVRLANQLKEENIQVDQNHPLMIYLPCGVGASPGGITFGMKQIFGDHVHCFFAEPTHAPSVLIGLLTGKMDKVCVQDFGIDNRTEADGLAVGRPSSFATAYNDSLVSGIYTIMDDDLFKLLAMFADRENVFLEPSATAGLLGPIKVLKSNYMKAHHINPKTATHIVWATGGNLVPKPEMDRFYKRGKELKSSD